MVEWYASKVSCTCRASQMAVKRRHNLQGVRYVLLTTANEWHTLHYRLVLFQHAQKQYTLSFSWGVPRVTRWRRTKCVELDHLVNRRSMKHAIWHRDACRVAEALGWFKNQDNSNILSNLTILTRLRQALTRWKTWWVYNAAWLAGHALPGPSSAIPHPENTSARKMF